MKAKTIRKVIRRKFDDFCSNIRNDHVRELVRKNTICTGGAIANLLIGEPVKDFDFYFRDKDTARAVAVHYCVEQHSLGPHVQAFVEETEEGRIRISVRAEGQLKTEQDPEVEEALDNPESSDDEPVTVPPPYRPLYLSENAITLSGKVQLIVRFYGEPEEIHRNYDFVHCTNFWTSWDNQLSLKADAMESLLSRDLRYIGSLYPVCSIMRARKFIERGFTCTAGQLLKMAFQVSALDLTDVSVLREQLVGVDSAYFNEVLADLEAKEMRHVDQAYLFEILDRIF